MKKLILSAAAIFAFGIASAQDGNGGMETPSSSGSWAKGDIFMSGSVGYENEATGDFKTNSFNFSPRVGFFVSDNIAIGIALGYEGATNYELDELLLTSAEVKENTLSVGAFGRYYFTPANQFTFFTELGVNYNSITEEVEGVDGEFKANGFEVAFRPGINYFISNNFAMEATVGVIRYETAKPDGDDAESTDTFEFGFNLTQINIGLVYKF